MDSLVVKSCYWKGACFSSDVAGLERSVLNLMVRIALLRAITVDHRQHPSVSPVKSVCRMEPRTHGEQGLLWPFP